MKRNIDIFICIAIFQLFYSCKDQSTSTTSLENLHIDFISGDMVYSGEPDSSSDKLSCQADLFVKNNSSIKTLSNLSINKGEVYISSTNQKIGTILFETSWDGCLSPLENDTVRLIKLKNDAEIIFPPPFGSIYLVFTIENVSRNTITFKTDGIGCRYLTTY